MILMDKLNLLTDPRNVLENKIQDLNNEKKELSFYGAFELEIFFRIFFLVSNELDQYGKLQTSKIYYWTKKRTSIKKQMFIQ